MGICVYADVDVYVYVHVHVCTYYIYIKSIPEQTLETLTMCFPGQCRFRLLVSLQHGVPSGCGPPGMTSENRFSTALESGPAAVC